ncbi:MAG: peptide deformylase [Candidatus Zixiibacteriota bacterium]
MAIKDILLLGNPLLHEVSCAVQESDLNNLAEVVQDIQDTLRDFRERYGVGRAIAAPQIGVMKRIIYMQVDKPEILINPVISNMSTEMIELWDDCMSFPELLVKVARHRSCLISYRNLSWDKMTLDLEDDLSELLQHECDHLDGILAVSRAIDGQSFALKSQANLLENS